MTVRRLTPLISIHIPRVGDDVIGITTAGDGGRFQSTSPVWGMTQNETVQTQHDRISIHIPRVGDDPVTCLQLACRLLFQSTSPVWGMTFQ